METSLRRFLLCLEWGGSQPLMQQQEQSPDLSFTSNFLRRKKTQLSFLVRGQPTSHHIAESVERYNPPTLWIETSTLSSLSRYIWQSLGRKGPKFLHLKSWEKEGEGCWHYQMAKRSDFAQKLLDDLRLRKEKLGFASSSQRSTLATSGGMFPKENLIQRNTR